MILLTIVPLLCAIGLLAILGRESRLIKPIALLGSLSPLAFALSLFTQIGASESFAWFASGNSQFLVSASLLPINFLLYILVSIIAPLVVVYSIGFMDVMSDNKRFYFELLSFEAAMLAFAFAGNFILLFIAWEFLSITSYLLIGFWNQKEKANLAARKAITTILIGDISLLGAMAILFSSYGTLEFSALISQANATGVGVQLLSAMGLVLIAIFTKSAQFPFQEWLSDAMEGPTPVSAFLHSSTMVKAGVFLVMVLFPIYSRTNLMWIIEIIGGITALIGISNAFASTHVKRVLAYSTIEELGLMLFALGMGAYSAAVYFFFAQTFYKALLFFYSGVLIKANKTEELGEMRDGATNKLIFVSALFGVLSLAGFIPFGGFFANAAIENSSVNMATYAFLLLVDISVSLFIARWFFIPLKSSTNRGMLDNSSIRYHTVPFSMQFPIVVLAIGCLVSSYFLGNVLGSAGSMANYGYGIGAMPFTFNIAQSAIETLLVLAGILAMYFLVYKKIGKQKSLLGQMLSNGSFFEELYSFIANFALFVAGAFEFLDAEINSLFDLLGKETSRVGFVLRRLESGLVNVYALLALLGLVALIVYMVIL